jgi:hypothetical protein
MIKKISFEITAIYSNSKRSEEFLKHNVFLTCYWRFQWVPVPIKTNALEQQNLPIGTNNSDVETYRKKLKRIWYFNSIHAQSLH